LIIALEEFGMVLEEYCDMNIGYAYYSLNEKLTSQAHYSNIVIKDCNPLCVYI